MPAIASNSPIGQRATFQDTRRRPGSERRGDGVPDRDGGEGSHDERSCADGKDQGSTVLLERRTVLLDAVEPVEPTLDLPHQRAGRDRRGDHEADQQEREVVGGARLVCLFDGVGEHLPGGPRGNRSERVGQQVAPSTSVNHACQRHEGDDALHEQQGHQEGE